MLVLALLLAQSAAAPSATPAATAAPAPALRPAPLLGRSEQGARPKTLSDHAAEMKAKGASGRRVSFDDVATADPLDAAPPAKEGGAGAPPPASSDAAAAAAQRRMDRAVGRGLAVPERTTSSRRANARREWDEAAEACRRTPGCVPQYRDDARYGENKPLKTDQELIDDIRKRGFSEPHPLPK